MRQLSAVWVAMALSLGCVATGREATSGPTVPEVTAAPAIAASPPAPAVASQPETPPPGPGEDPMAALVATAARASPGARRVLDATRAMLDAQTIVRGSCYRWVDAVFHRAGGRSRAAFRGSRETPFADSALIQPGDWVFFVNHSYGDVTHSAIFVAWTDEPARTALMVSYAGGNRQSPGRFGLYELSNVYRLLRMSDEPAVATNLRAHPP